MINQEDHSAARSALAHLAQHFDAIHGRQRDIGNDDVRFEVKRCLQQF